jgi:hypothetical protein
VHRGHGGGGATDDIGRWDDRWVLGRHGECQGAMVTMEHSRGAVVELGGGAQRERWAPCDDEDNTEGGWDGRRTPRRRGEHQSDMVTVELWRVVVLRWSAIARCICGGLDELI